MLAATASRAAEPVVLDAPEAVHWHAPSRSWFVSNLGGGLSLERDDYGWITRYDADGKLLASRWIEFLDAPTGMASHGDRLYVVDRDGLVEIAVPTAQVVKVHALPDASFLNDVAVAEDGTAYVSDTGKNRIYRIAPGGTAEIWVEDAALQSPNGLIVDGGRVVVGAWGPMTDLATFATRHAGTLIGVDRATGAIAPLGKGEPIAHFDGVVAYRGGYFATDWKGGRLLSISTTGEVREVLRGFWQLADLGLDPERAIIGMPVMSENRVIFLHLDALAAP
jgi:outer membrane protein assembly factor BamB